jgi:hypothetical protein
LLQDAESELRRADHLLYISLRYTRTVDVMKNVIARLIAAYDLGILALLEDLKAKNKVDEIPESWKTRAELLMKLKRNSKPYITEYLLLRGVEDAPCSVREEYRKNITMICNIEGKDVEINVPKLTEYFKNTKSFLEYAEGELS